MWNQIFQSPSTIKIFWWCLQSRKYTSVSVIWLILLTVSLWSWLVGIKLTALKENRGSGSLWVATAPDKSPHLFTILSGLCYLPAAIAWKWKPLFHACVDRHLQKQLNHTLCDFPCMSPWQSWCLVKDL